MSNSSPVKNLYFSLGEKTIRNVAEGFHLDDDLKSRFDFLYINIDEYRKAKRTSGLLMSKSKVNILKKILEFNKNGRHCYFSQETMGDKVGIERGPACRTLAWLERNQYIFKFEIKGSKTLLYILNTEKINLEIRKLKDITKKQPQKKEKTKEDPSKKLHKDINNNSNKLYGGIAIRFLHLEGKEGYINPLNYTPKDLWPIVHELNKNLTVKVPHARVWDAVEKMKKIDMKKGDLSVWRIDILIKRLIAWFKIELRPINWKHLPRKIYYALKAKAKNHAKIVAEKAKSISDMLKTNISGTFELRTEFISKAIASIQNNEVNAEGIISSVLSKIVSIDQDPGDQRWLNISIEGYGAFVVIEQKYKYMLGRIAESFGKKLEIKLSE